MAKTLICTMFRHLNLHDNLIAIFVTWDQSIWWKKIKLWSTDLLSSFKVPLSFDVSFHFMSIKALQPLKKLDFHLWAPANCNFENLPLAERIEQFFNLTSATYIELQSTTDSPIAYWMHLMSWHYWKLNLSPYDWSFLVEFSPFVSDSLQFSRKRNTN